MKLIKEYQLVVHATEVDDAVMRYAQNSMVHGGLIPDGARLEWRQFAGERRPAAVITWKEPE